ncbi:MAG: type II toxin-antitoxin system VapC family toxin [Planctomycetota bacterium]
MKLLLDTHAFIWWDSLSSRLSSQALAACADPANELLLSVASVWEMQIKPQLGKLQLRTPLTGLIKEQERTNRIGILRISIDHVFAVGNLPPLHRDPFDRLLIAQAIEERASLVSNDSLMSQYPVKVLW